MNKDFKKEYNELIARLDKAHKFLEKNVDGFENEKIFNEYKKIVSRLSYLNKQYELENGYLLNDKNKFEGF